MSEQVASGRRRIDILRSAIAQSMTGEVVLIAFNSEARIMKSIPDPSGGTAMHLALNFAMGYARDSRAVLVTDGEPDDGDAALMAAKNFPIPLQTIFCGNAGSAGDLFLKKIAAVKGGTHNQVAWDSAPTQLQQTIRGLLAA